MFLYKNKNTTEDKNRSTLMETPGMDTEFATIFNLMQTITCFYENLTFKYARIFFFTRVRPFNSLQENCG